MWPPCPGGDRQWVHEGGLRTPFLSPFDAWGDVAVEAEPVLSWARCLLYPQGIAACLSAPFPALAEALAGEICDAGAPQTCREP